MPTTILIVDDDESIRVGMTRYMSHYSSFDAIGVASTGRDALSWLNSHSCDIVLSDIHMPDLDGLELLHELKAQNEAPAFIAMTAFDTDETMLKVLAHGAAGYIVKSEPPAEIIAALAQVANDAVALSPQCVARMVERSVLGHPALTDVSRLQSLAPQRRVSPDEAEILRGIRTGSTNSSIARKLGFTEVTVKKKLGKLLARFQASNRSELIYLSQFDLPAEDNNEGHS